MNILLRNSFYFAIAISLLISSSLLNHFIPYTLDGGNPIYKIHPSTYLMSAILLFSFILLKVKIKLIKKNNCVQFILSILIISFISLIQFGTSGLAYLIDTYLVAGMAVLIYSIFIKRTDRRIFKIILYIIIFNSIFAIVETILNINFIPIEKDFGFHRSTALFGHPLNNGLITASVLIIFYNVKYRAVPKNIMLFIMFLALLSFGSRAALVGVIIGIVLSEIIKIFYTKYTKIENLIIKVTTVNLSIIMVVTVVLLTIFFTPIGDKITSRMEMDDSIQSRLTAIEFIKQFELSEILFGVSGKTYRSYIESESSIKELENYWVVLLLKVGFISTLIFAISLLLMLKAILKDNGKEFYLATIIFLLISSTNNSLTVKTSALTIFLIFLLSAIDYKYDQMESSDVQ